MKLLNFLKETLCASEYAKLLNKVTGIKIRHIEMNIREKFYVVAVREER